jgi:hypothetical protein
MRNSFTFVYKQHHNRLSSHHVFGNVSVVGGVSMWIENVEHFFASKNLFLFMENFEMVVLNFLVDFFKLIKRVKLLGCNLQHPISRQDEV